MVKNRRHFSLRRMAKRLLNLIRTAFASRRKKRPRSRRSPAGSLACRNTAEAETTSPVSVPISLCAVCDGMFTGLLVMERGIPHHQSIASLLRAAGEGCHICKMIAGNVQSNITTFSGSDIPKTASFEWSLHLKGVEELGKQNGLYIDYGHIIIYSIHHRMCLRLLGTKGKVAAHSDRTNGRLKG